MLIVELEDEIKQSISQLPEVEVELAESVSEYGGMMRQKFWMAYLTPKSKTFWNARASALAAGYSECTAIQITGKAWFKQKVMRLGLLEKAEKVILKTLDMETKDRRGIEQADLLRIQTDVAKHITKTLGKDEGYSERTELTGKGGEDIQIAQIVFNLPDKQKKEVLDESKQLDAISTPAETQE